MKYALILSLLLLAACHSAHIQTSDTRHSGCAEEFDKKMLPLEQL